QAEAVSLGHSVGLAPSFATNNVGNTVQDFVDNATVKSSSGGVTVGASEAATILAITAAGTLRSTAVTGAAAVALNNTSDTVDAHLSGGANVSAPGTVSVTANNSSTITGVSGAVAGFVGTVSFGGSVATNQIGDTTKAYLDHATATSTGNSVVVQAT